MSWGVQAAGKVAAVRLAIATQFARAIESTQFIPEEQAQVRAAEQAVKAHLDFLEQSTHVVGVSVVGNGSFSRSDSTESKHRSASFKLEINPIYGFVE